MAPVVADKVIAFAAVMLTAPVAACNVVVDPVAEKAPPDESVMVVPAVALRAVAALTATAPLVDARVADPPESARVPLVDKEVAEVALSVTDGTLMSRDEVERRKYFPEEPSSKLMAPVLAFDVAEPVLRTMLPLAPPDKVPAPVAK